MKNFIFSESNSIETGFGIPKHSRVFCYFARMKKFANNLFYKVSFVLEQMCTTLSNHFFFVFFAFIFRFCKPSEIGAVVAFLASDDASYVTGETIVVAGGQNSRL